jgi:hypothetical protein
MPSRFANDKPEQYSGSDFGMLERATDPNTALANANSGITTNAENL